jgi:hypothetical protein
LTLTHPTLPTIQAIETIHRAQALLNSKKLPRLHATELNARLDAVVSFTVFSLRDPNPRVRPEQLRAYENLVEFINTIESTK